MNTRRRIRLPSCIMHSGEVGEVGDHLVHQTTSYARIDVVGYELNRTRKRVGSFPFKIQLFNWKTRVPGPQATGTTGNSSVAAKGAYGILTEELFVLTIVALQP